jgi:broad specificity phosphatase PhoE
MHLYLIRHGETVDNVAGLYAGSRDSQLTNHGVEQTKRLGQHFARNGVTFTHIFASPLSRAHRTAEAILKAQPTDHDSGVGEGIEIVKKDELKERDFGSFEGKPFSSRTRSGEDGDDVETKEALAKRVDVFLDECLLPLLEQEEGGRGSEPVVAVVAHGMLLAHFWRRLLLRIPKQSLTIASEVAERRGDTGLEYIGGWSNTGYMELQFKKVEEVEDTSSAGATGAPDDTVDEATLPTPVPPSLEPGEAAIMVSPRKGDTQNKRAQPRLLSKWYVQFVLLDISPMTKIPAQVHNYTRRRQHCPRPWP